ncbi:MAG TPA: class I SAM-dependent methyltransferase [Candidatus Polarisedimenticolia bacterium]|jgi:SAM-dependent methyltransferase|nr:class I SAM-dependent methyltransferase [Candidatus Polarisedimenticolia bacterium]
MLDRLLRQRTRPPDGSEAPGDASRSHVFPRFLKWLSAREHPSVLDLGRLSGANIELLARLGCRVQVEDLMRSAEEALAAAQPQTPASEPHAAAALPHIPETIQNATNGGTNGGSHRPATAVSESAPGASPAQASSSETVRTATAAGAGGPSAAPGAVSAGSTAPAVRPTRHIVLPPRTFGTSRNASGANGANGTPQRVTSQRPVPITLPLPTSFSYDDATFDAIVGWDLFNYYDPARASRLGPDVVRLLRPGGIVFATFHARREEAPDGPARHRIVDESHIQVDPYTGPPASRHLYQNRDIEKTFSGLKIVELYFLRHGVREMLLEKRATITPPAIGGPAKPRPRFRIE